MFHYVTPVVSDMEGEAGKRGETRTGDKTTGRPMKINIIRAPRSRDPLQ
jgi:hypothetical protein